MIVARIAYRNIYRQKRRSFFTALTMVGGFVLLSASLAISNGTYDHVIRLFTRSFTGHVQVHKEGYLDKPSVYESFDELDKIANSLSRIEGIVSWTPRVYTKALAFIGKKTNVAQLVGIDPAEESDTTAIKGMIAQGRYISGSKDNEIIIGGGIAEVLDAKLMDDLVLIAQGTDGSIANDVFRVVGIMKSNTGPLTRMNCYAHIGKVQEFLSMGQKYHELIITLDDYSTSSSKSFLIAEALKGNGLDVKPWEAIQKNFYSAMKADQKGMWIGLSIIITIVGFGVLNTVLMSILERTREFGILRALGTRPWSMFAMILFESGYLSLVSVAVGTIISFCINYLLSLHGIDYPQSVDMGGFTISTMYGSVFPMNFYIPAILIFSVSLFISIVPAVRVMRITPMKAMRTV